MSNRALRILIADNQHFQRMQIERALNQLGYYRIAPVHRLEELLTLVEYSSAPFDLAIISASFDVADGFDLLAFCMDNRQLHQVLIYDCPGWPGIASHRRQSIHVSQAQLPDREALGQLMRLIDPADYPAQAGPCPR
ncbi:chemotaxis protein CheY [Pseudomonas sp. FW507-12TSA]|nr:MULTISPECIES: response regulator [unclassified Pseudomonas]POA52302.1 chemotaxis protein CheY [Pseudomonas sp. FW507-12TSA]